MAVDNSHLQHSFTVDEVFVMGHPEPNNVFNQFDQLGLLVGVKRLSGEYNPNYKQRLLDAYTNRANSTYMGLINGVTRELGLDLYTGLTISPKVSGDEYIAANPVVLFKGPYVELWQDYEGDLLEMEIDRFDPDGDAYTITELADYINANSIYFQVDSVPSATQFKRSMCIVNQISTRQVLREIIPQSTRLTLTNPGLIDGAIILETLYFTDVNTFRTRVDTIDEVDGSGKYYVNRYTGDIASYDTPLPGASARYSYIVTNYKAITSPVIIHDLQSANFKRKMFTQILNDDGVYSDSIPTPMGADLINELMSVYPLYYGV